MRTRSQYTLLALTALLWLSSPPVGAQQSAGDGGAADGGAGGSALTTLEGRVSNIRESSGEGGLRTLEITLETASARRRLLLAPRTVLQQMGFNIETGDQIRARVFVGEGAATASVQRIQNRSRAQMVRLRTLRRVPVWRRDGAGGATRSGAPKMGALKRRSARQRLPARRPARRQPMRPARRASRLRPAVR